MFKYFFSLGIITIACVAQAKDTIFSLEKKGKTPLYEYYGVMSQDLSGAAFDGKGNVLLGFDGGRNSQSPEVRVVNELDIEKPAKIIDRRIIQKDIEGMAFSGGNFYVVSSMSQANEDTHDFRILSEVVFDSKQNSIISERYIYLRKAILDSLSQHFKNKKWFSKVSSSFGKHGGLNVEGISATNHKNQLLVGLRSPLWSPEFGSKAFGDEMSLSKGDAILLKVDKPFSKDSKMEVLTVNLKGQGIRGIEYVAELDSYIIISGPVEKGSNFQLWSYHRTTEHLTKIQIPEFYKLCRPESIVPIEKENVFYVFSEESGAACQDMGFSYLKIKYEI